MEAGVSQLDFSRVCADWRVAVVTEPAVFNRDHRVNHARAVGFLGFGFYPRSGFMHVDLGPARRWGERFPVRATAFAAETPRARKVLADSRTMKGGGAAGPAVPAGGHRRVQPLVRHRKKPGH
jgi:hypothetical protein